MVHSVEIGPVLGTTYYPGIYRIAKGQDVVVLDINF